MHLRFCQMSSNASVEAWPHISHARSPKQERSDPDLLSKTAARRRRVAQASGYSEAEVTTMMATFTQMRAQMLNMSRMMKLGTAEGVIDEGMDQGLRS